jgi:hypothetical protein
MKANGRTGQSSRDASCRLIKLELTLLDVVVRERSAILELLSGKDQPLLIRRDSLLVLNLCLDVVDRVGRLDLESDRLSGQAEPGKQEQSGQAGQLKRSMTRERTS